MGKLRKLGKQLLKELWEVVDMLGSIGMFVAVPLLCVAMFLVGALYIGVMGIVYLLSGPL